jgi:hypothetical protein
MMISRLFTTAISKWKHGKGVGIAVMLWRDENGGFSHNLRAVLIGASGRVQIFFIGNEWKPDELVEEMVKAAAARL